MIINEADNVMYGDTEVLKVYCGDALVWGNEPVRPVPSGYENLPYFSFPEGGNRAINTGYRPVTIPCKMETRLRQQKYTPNGQSFSYIIGGVNSDPVSYNQYYMFHIVVTNDGAYIAEITGQKQGSTVTTIIQAPITNSHSHAPALGTWFDMIAVWDLKNVKLTVGSAYNSSYTATPYKSFIARDVWIGANGNPTGTGLPLYFTGDMSYFKLYKGDGTLARDMVPAKRDSDGREGFYDFITGNFYTYA